MNEIIKRSAVIALVVLILSGNAVGQRRAKPEADRQGSRGLYLQKQFLRFMQHNSAFLNFAHNHIEPDLTMEFSEAAKDASTCASAVGVLFSIYDQLSCRADRDMTWPILKAELASQAHLLDLSAKQVDHNIADYVKTPAVAAAAARMKQDMDELKAFLERTEREQTK